MRRFMRTVECGVLTVEGISMVKITSFCTSSTKLHIGENCVIVLPVSILTAGFLGCTTHYCVS